MAAPLSRKSTLDFLGREGGGGRGVIRIIRANLPIGSSEAVMGVGGRREAIAPDFIVSVLLMGVIEASQKAVQQFLPCTSVVSTL